LTSKKLAKIIAESAFDKKAEEIVVLDMKKIVNFCDYFVICSGNTDRHVHAIANGIGEGLDIAGVKIPFKQGKNASSWLVFDTGDVVAHVFQKEARDFYKLEYLWKEANEVSWKTKT